MVWEKIKFGKKKLGNENMFFLGIIKRKTGGVKGDEVTG